MTTFRPIRPAAPLSPLRAEVQLSAEDKQALSKMQGFGNDKTVTGNNCGNVFEVTPQTQLDRFLICGTTGGTYYQSANSLIEDNFKVLLPFIETNPLYAVNRAVEISDSGRAKNNDYALAVLALAFSTKQPEAVAAASEALPKIARTGTHLLHFVDMVKGLKMRGWGSSLKKPVARWFLNQDVDKLAYQVAKYPNRDGWSMRDVLRLSHPKAKDETQNLVFKYVTAKDTITDKSKLPAILQAVEEAKDAPVSQLVNLISTHRLSREMIPTETLNQRAVWEALLPHMGATALIRNLGKLTQIGILDNGSSGAGQISSLLTNREFLRKGRIHPMQMWIAKKTYDQGRGTKGSLTWAVNRTISKALEDGFYESFKEVTPTGKRILMALDISGSMASYFCSGAEILSCREASAILAMVSLRRETNTEVVGFSHSLIDLRLSAEDNLQQTLAKISGLPFGGTECSLPILRAIAQKSQVDAFCIYTDNETGRGPYDPMTALRYYRQKSGIDAKMVVTAMTASRFSIADPSDAGSLDLAGFDANGPALISSFISGEF